MFTQRPRIDLFLLRFVFCSAFLFHVLRHSCMHPDWVWSPLLSIASPSSTQARPFTILNKYMDFRPYLARRCTVQISLGAFYPKSILGHQKTSWTEPCFDSHHNYFLFAICRFRNFLTIGPGLEDTELRFTPPLIVQKQPSSPITIASGACVFISTSVYILPWTFCLYSHCVANLRHFSCHSCFS